MEAVAVDSTTPSRHRHRERPRGENRPVGSAPDSDKVGTAAVLRQYGTMAEKMVAATIHSHLASILARRRAGVRCPFHPALILATRRVRTSPSRRHRKRASWFFPVRRSLGGAHLADQF